MTIDEINTLISIGATRKCNDCDTELPVSEFFIKKGKTEVQYRFNSPCKSCANVNRNRNYHASYFRKMKYNVSDLEYEQMLIKQNYSCAICEEHYSKFNKALSIDHCHNTGKIRGLLCGNCNSGIGMLKDSITLVKSAANYLAKYKVQDL
jgi:hypothetical protein